MSKHSPGPWGLNPNRPCEVRVLIDGKATGQLVADTSTVNVLVPWLENAILIAAAPAMLAALKVIQEQLALLPDAHIGNKIVHFALMQAGNAIALAEGEK